MFIGIKSVFSFVDNFNSARPKPLNFSLIQLERDLKQFLESLFSWKRYLN